MKTFGTTFDPDFGDCYDTAMIITVADIYKEKRERYIESFENEDYGQITLARKS